MAGKKTTQAPEKTPEQIAKEKLERQVAKAGKFQEIANRRVASALKALDLISNLSNRGQYHYDEDQVAMIESLLTDKVKSIMATFKVSGSSPDKPSIDLGIAK